MKVYRDRQRVAGLLREIKVLAASLASCPPKDTVGLEIETKAAIASSFHRTFWSEPAQFAQVDLTEHEADEDRRAEAFRALALMRRLDWRGMRASVQAAVARRGSLTLGDLLSEHPPEAGAIEVLGYLQIARDDGHIIMAWRLEGGYNGTAYDSRPDRKGPLRQPTNCVDADAGRCPGVH